MFTREFDRTLSVVMVLAILGFCTAFTFGCTVLGAAVGGLFGLWLHTAGPLAMGAASGAAAGVIISGVGVAKLRPQL